MTNDTRAGVKSKRPGSVNGSGGKNGSTGEEVSKRYGVILIQHNKAYINPNWVLLDSESKDHIFCKEKPMTDMKPTADGK